MGSSHGCLSRGALHCTVRRSRPFSLCAIPFSWRVLVMQRLYLYGGLCICVVAGSLVAWRLAHSQPAGGDPNAAGKPATALPITQVILFNSGVGYLQREGDVTGDKIGRAHVGTPVT